MTTLTPDPVRSARGGRAHNGRGPRLGGPAWLILRQHRAAFWTLFALTLLCVIAMVCLRGQMMNYLDALGSSQRKAGSLPPDFEKYSNRLSGFGGYLGYLPVLAGVFLGAPLIAGDLETGTAKLVTSQSVSRLRWLAAKLAIPAVLIALSAAVLGAVFSWWWHPVKTLTDQVEWTSGTFFDVTGIMPVAYALLTFAVGAAVGMLLRRTLVSMVVTLGIVVAIGVVWDRFRLDLGHVLSVSTSKGVGPGARLPKLPAEAVQQGRGTYFLTSSGGRLDWTTCLDAPDNEKAHTACLESRHVIGWSMDYLPVSQMHTMQWLGAGIMLTLTAAIAAFVILWGRKRLL
ncbi:ABC transporter permease subunit [Streptomyces sp. NBC_00859]|uniref:ABC transporter permease subunit n=1 Tax=Streptomyces sp. NBC_00859 TaxID=2903682 RepID=UPI0038703300|nr:ABC transporter permease [Streptomyces sp. NBC_00859]WSZ86743.1 ABC transporter permease [Streptomyces sp. NBC_00859]